MMQMMSRESLAEAIATQIVSVARMVGGAVLTDDEIDQIACVAAQDILRYALTSAGAAQVVEELHMEQIEDDALAPT